MRTEREAVRLRRAMTVGTVRRILDGSFLFVPLIRVFARTGKPQRVEKLIGQPRSWKPNPPGASSVCPHPCVRVRVSAFLSRCSRLFVRVPPSVCLRVCAGRLRSGSGVSVLRLRSASAFERSATAERPVGPGGQVIEIRFVLKSRCRVGRLGLHGAVALARLHAMPESRDDGLYPCAVDLSKRGTPVLFQPVFTSVGVRRVADSKTSLKQPGSRNSRKGRQIRPLRL